MIVNLYKVSGMTCQACTKIVHEALSKVPGTKKVMIDLSKAQAEVEMEHHVPIAELKAALSSSLYEIEGADTGVHAGDEGKNAPGDLSEVNKILVSSYLSAAGKLDHRSIAKYLHPDFKFNGAAKYSSADGYVQMIKDHANSPVSNFLLRYDIQAIFVDDNDCSVIYDAVSCFPGKKVSFVEQIKIKDGKIVSTDVRFNRHQLKLLMLEVKNANKTS